MEFYEELKRNLDQGLTLQHRREEKGQTNQQGQMEAKCPYKSTNDVYGRAHKRDNPE